jgi:Trypsin-like peptidase domain
MNILSICLALIAASGGGVMAEPFGFSDAVRPQSSFRLEPVNIIDGIDDRGSLSELGPSLGLSADEIGRIRKVSGYVGCLSPSPSLGSGALYLTNRQILTAGHIFFEPSGRPRSKCFFKNQDRAPVMIDLLVDADNARFGAVPPKPGSNYDYAVVRLETPLAGAEPFPVNQRVAVRAGDDLIVVTSHPAGMAREVDRAVPVVQGCKVRRAPKSSSVTNFYRSDCDATGTSSGGMNLSRVDGNLVFRGITITTGPWRDGRFFGAPYDEKAGSVTTALGTDAAVLAAGKELADGAP